MSLLIKLKKENHYMADQQEVRRLLELASEMRKKLLYLCGHYDGPIHIGGDLSMTELLIGLFHHGLNIDPKNIMMPTRDRFILSKGHGAVGMYIAMALRGFFDYEEIVRTYGQLDSAFGMHTCKVQLPGVECSSGSLGQGLAIAVGMAFSARQKELNHRVFCLMGDGETCEGEIWEAANTASSYGLGNLIGIVDRNKQFMWTHDGENMTLEPYGDRWKSFGWKVLEIDGHNLVEIIDTLDNLPPISNDKPTMILAHTIKGKGVSFMEHAISWHAGALNKEDMAKAMDDVKTAWEKERSAW